MDYSRYKKAKELIEFATSFDVDEIYEAAGHPYPARALANSITPFVVERAKEAGIGGEDLTYSTSDGNISQILWHGINDTQEVLIPHVKLQPTPEHAIAFVEHGKTIEAFARLALRSEGAMSGLVYLMSSGEHAPQEAAEYLQLPPVWQLPSSNGCPAAKHTTPESIKPIWRNFITWTGHIVVKSVIHHQGAVHPAFAQNQAEPADLLIPKS